MPMCHRNNPFKSPFPKYIILASSFICSLQKQNNMPHQNFGQFIIPFLPLSPPSVGHFQRLRALLPLSTFFAPRPFSLPCWHQFKRAFAPTKFNLMWHPPSHSESAIFDRLKPHCLIPTI
jgi:hypothetical protein